jgi:4-amino-4-deoxy-L-arabinose transferase-like glycosyltransferase
MKNVLRDSLRQHGALLLVLTLGAVLRFANLGLIRHGYDASYPIYDALRILSGHEFPLLGQPSSVFLDNPPLMGYLQALPLLVWRSPWAVYLFVITLNTIAIAFVYRVAQALLGNTVAFFAALLFAINPWLIVYSRWSWVQGLLPFFMALIAWSLWPALLDRSRSAWRLIIAALALAMLLMTYLQAWGVLVPIGLLLIVFRRNLRWRPIIIGAAIVGLACAIYGVGLVQNWDTNASKFEAFTSQGERHFTREGIDHALRFVTGMDFEYQAPTFPDTNWRLSISTLAMLTLSVAVMAGAARSVQAIIRQRAECSVAVVLLIWFVVPILMMSISARPIHPHYLLLSIPAGAVLAAWGVELIWRVPRLRWIVIAAFTLITIVFAINLWIYEADMIQHPTAPKFDGWSLEAGARVGDQLRALTHDLPAPQRISANGQASILSSWSGQYLKNLNGLKYPDFVVLPGAQPLLYVLNTVSDPPAYLGSRWQWQPDRDLNFADGAQVAFRQALPLSRAQALALPAHPIDVPSESGLSLLGYTISQTNEITPTLDVITDWRVDELKPDRESWYVGPYYQVLQPDGTRVANVGEHGQWGYRWEVGDVYVDHVRIPLPGRATGIQQLVIGLTDSIHQRNFALQSGNGSQSTLAIPLPMTGH